MLELKVNVVGGLLSGNFTVLAAIQKKVVSEAMSCNEGLPVTLTGGVQYSTIHGELLIPTSPVLGFVKKFNRMDNTAILTLTEPVILGMVNEVIRVKGYKNLLRPTLVVSFLTHTFTNQTVYSGILTATISF